MKIFAKIFNGNKPLIIFEKTPSEMSDRIPNTPLTCVSTQRHIYKKESKSKTWLKKRENNNQFLKSSVFIS